MENNYDVIIIGAGPAGCSAGIYCARYKMKTLILDATPGGLAKDAHKVENYPGFESITGMDLMEKITHHAKKTGADIVTESVVEIKKEDDKFKVLTDATNEYFAEYLVIATGSKRQKLGIPGEDKLYGRGISYCATCDAAFFKGKDVAVVGGGNSAVMAAALLAEYSKKVHMIYRGSELKAEPVWNDRIHNNPKIDIRFNSEVSEAIGEKRLEKIKLKNGEEISVSGLFIEVGNLPSADIARSLGVKLDSKERIHVTHEMRTNVPKVYAAGDVTSGSAGFQQIVTALAEGSIAAYDIFRHKKGKVEYT